MSINLGFEYDLFIFILKFLVKFGLESTYQNFLTRYSDLERSLSKFGFKKNTYIKKIL